MLNTPEIHQHRLYLLTKYCIFTRSSVPFLLGNSSSAFAINSEQSSGVQLTCRNGLDFRCASLISSPVLTSRKTAAWFSDASFTRLGGLSVDPMAIVDVGGKDSWMLLCSFIVITRTMTVYLSTVAFKKKRKFCVCDASPRGVLELELHKTARIKDSNQPPLRNVVRRKIIKRLHSPVWPASRRKIPKRLPRWINFSCRQWE